MLVHLICNFVALAHAHGWTVHAGTGPGGWAFWVQPRGIAQGIAQVRAQDGAGRGAVVGWAEVRRAG